MFTQQELNWINDFGYLNDGEDCSEVARRLQELLGKGKLVTIVSHNAISYVSGIPRVDPNQLSANGFKINTTEGYFCYHTVLVADRHIIDISQPVGYRVISFKDYARMLLNLNEYNFYPVALLGYWDDKPTRKFDRFNLVVDEVYRNAVGQPAPSLTWGR